MGKPQTRAKILDLREACITEAMHIIETSGVEGLSLREVARRLGVSHQAPYKHFPSRDHILAEIVRRTFDIFASYLDAQAFTGEPITDLAQMGRAYLEYAATHPLQYRLMFGTPLPNPEQHPDMMQSARRAFDVMRDCLTRMAAERGEASPLEVDLNALFIWSTVHGLASISQTYALERLAFSDEVMHKAPLHILERIAVGLGVQLPPLDPPAG